MTEAEWLACETPERMLAYLRGRASERKLRLFAVAAARPASPWLIHAISKEALEVGEKVAEGVCGSEALNQIRRVAWDLFPLGVRGYGIPHVSATRAAARTVERQAQEAADNTRHEIANVFAELARQEGVLEDERRRLYFAGRRRVEAQLASLLREVFGNPFRPVTLPPAVLAWQDATVSLVARAAYDNRQFPEGTLDAPRLALLADALEDAGCADAELLGHLRRPGPHVRGCWAMDLVLGKA
jgi:hypothetical protein